MWLFLALTTAQVFGGVELANDADTPPPFVKLDPVFRVGSWIWTAETFDRQNCRLWKTITIPRDSTVIDAHLRITVDNSYELFFDGRRIGQGSEWHYLTDYNITSLLTPGTHVVAVEAFNESAQAGLLAGIWVDFLEGNTMEAASDASWRIVPNSERGWLNRTQPRTDWAFAGVIEPFGYYPWLLKPLRVNRLPPEQPVVLHFWQSGWFQITLVAVSALVMSFCLRLMAQLAVQKRAQQMLQIERVRIARDFHDDLGARITQLVLLCEVAQRELPRDTVTRNKLEQLCERMRDFSGAIREIVWVVNSQRDTLLDFATYVCNYAESFLGPTSIRCRFDVGEEFPEIKFDLPIRRNLFLSVKEALNNAAKHSGADELFLRIHYEAETVKVVVEDNGKGFDPALANPDRNGLQNMTQRMKQLGGSCTLTSQPGKGCRIEFSMPLAQTNRRQLKK